ncbi:hypothetical protein PIB30_108697 [Stylosanthes scabra]|uniref:Uncharacterized protein n=1 Tax=Stylosanthes scabra TaxID=79078 RepID=A0ABU6YX84_9FABA|nr:hypothetical protein [Stylosanthes scabra]
MELISMPLTLRPCRQHGDLNDTDSIQCKLHYWNSEPAARAARSGLSACNDIWKCQGVFRCMKLTDDRHHYIYNDLLNLHLLVEKRAKGSLQRKKEENRVIGSKTELQYHSRVLTPRLHYPRLGVAEPPSPFSLIHHPMSRRDARRLGVDEAARKMTLHQGLNAQAWTQNA